MRRTLVVVLAAGLLGVLCPSVARADGPAFVVPVPGPVVDPWRAPAGRYGAGNRGIDFATTPGEVVRASGDGEVVFAGQVGGSLHVVVLHPGGVRTSYSFLASIAVRRGDRVRQGDVVGTAERSVHFGVRVGDDYVDPATLLAGTVEVHLVPDDLRRPGSWWQERLGLLRGVAVVVGATAQGVAWASEALDGAVDWSVGIPALVAQQGWEAVQAELMKLGDLAELAVYYGDISRQWIAAYRRLQEFDEDQAGCTPRSVRPRRPRRRRIAVLVGGFGSTSTHGGVLDLPTRALGYADHDVAVFSYAGGQIGGRRHIDGIDVAAYGQRQANGDLRASAKRLRQVLVRIRSRNPGVPVDLIGFSQGGVVARAALADSDGSDPREPKVANLITIGAPHHGAQVATGLAAVGASGAGWATLKLTESVSDLEPTSTAAGELRAGSDFIDWAGRQQLPAGTRFTSIAAAGDLVVPAPNSAVGPATNVLLPGAPGLGVHGHLPASRAVGREIGLAIAGRGPTCRSTGAAELQALGTVIVEDGAAGGLALAGQLVGKRIESSVPRVPRPTRSPGPAGRP